MVSFQVELSFREMMAFARGGHSTFIFRFALLIHSQTHLSL